MIYDLADIITPMMGEVALDVSELLEGSVQYDVNDVRTKEEVTCNLYQHGIRIASFTLSLLPGNANVLISHSVWVTYHMWGKGIGSLLHTVRLNAAKAVGADAIVCTVRHDNKRELAILAKNNWDKLSDVTSYASMFVKKFDNTITPPEN